VYVFPAIAHGGMVVVDDYTYSKERDARCPRQGIDAFMNAYSPYVKVVHLGWQAIFIKLKVSKSKVDRCFSEYYD
jgi:hypothetical protein